jgi:hypothetical protein
MVDLQLSLNMNFISARLGQENNGSDKKCPFNKPDSNDGSRKSREISDELSISVNKIQIEERKISSSNEIIKVQETDLQNLQKNEIPASQSTRRVLKAKKTISKEKKLCSLNEIMKVEQTDVDKLLKMISNLFVVPEDIPASHKYCRFEKNKYMSKMNVWVTYGAKVQ